ncbi:MAG TPA: S53 family peptidase [Solirubrobacteraceae bacterium]|nr:S53 family peptidase [Solirubrobacteraceae bacterium]
MPPRDLVIEETLTRMQARRHAHTRAVIASTGRGAALRTAAVACVCVGAAAPVSVAHAELASSAYEVRSLCAAPAPGYSSCLGMRLVPKPSVLQAGSQAQVGSIPPEAEPSGRATQREGSAQTSAEVAKTKKIESKPVPGSYSPAQIAAAYGLTGLQPPGAQQTIALVDAFDDQTIEHDLEVFDNQFGLPACTTANGCFTKVRLSGATTQAGWAQEISTDVEISHGLCPSCKILLVEAGSNANPALEEAEAEAERLGATEISNSWGGPSPDVTVRADDAGPFNHPGTVITASSGDDGFLNWYSSQGHSLEYVDYPAASPHVVAVGGTRLRLSERTGAWEEETVWNGYGAGGGGCSTIFAAPVWQQQVADWSSVGCGAYRAVADVSADADPYTGVAVYDSTPVEEDGTEYSGWVTMGGTSVASPIIASTFALAGGAGADQDGQRVEYPARTLYESLAARPAGLHDIESGSNGVCSQGFDETGASDELGTSICSASEEARSCSGNAICLAGNGYDGPTGVGTPDGVAAFEPSSAAGSAGESEASVGGPGEAAGEEGSSDEQPGSGEDGAEGGWNDEAEEGLGEGEDATASEAATVSPPTLTRATLAALTHARVHVSQLRFTFTLSKATRIRVTLAKLVETHGRNRWQTLAGGLTIAARKGHDHASLNAHTALARGIYRLTLVPSSGKARSLEFPVS